MKFEHTEVWGFAHAIRGMRNPMNSWTKSDSIISDGFEHIGKSDLQLMQRLIAAGSEHRKFMRQIFVSVDITAPDYFFKEFSTYRIGITENSTSTMHKIMSKPFTVDMFECEGMRGYKFTPIYSPNEIDEETEMWKLHPYYENYEISNQGRVKRLQYIDADDTNKAVRKEKILAGSVHNDGYICVSICLGKQKYKQVPKHRLVAETWIPNPNNKPEVNHIDGNKQNNSVENLEWVTSSENQKHAICSKLQPVPVSTYKGKLTKEQRDEIIKRYNCENISRRELAQIYNVSHTTISALINNKYNYGENTHNEFEEFKQYLDELNELRDEYLITKDKQVWKTLIQKLPMNYLYTRTVTMNYENLYTIYHQRKNHKLNEWSGTDNGTLPNFISWIKDLPYAEELIVNTQRGTNDKG